MRNVIAIFIVMMTLARGIGQETLTNLDLDNAFVLEQINNKFELIKAELNDIQVIFRHDRLEIFERHSGNEELRTFLFFEGCLPTQPQANNLLESYNRPIENQGMAEALNASRMTVQKFSEVIYPGLYEGADLVVSMAEGSVVFNLRTKDGSVRDLKLRSWGDTDLSTSSGKIVFTKHSGLTIESGQNDMALLDNRIEFKSNAKNKFSSTSFEINLK